MSAMSWTPSARRVRFTYEDDLQLLREVVSENPFKNTEVWEEISKKMQLLTGKTFSIRTLKHHLDLLIAIWLKKDEIDKIRSGIEEPISEKDELLREASMLNFEFKSEGAKKNIPTKEQTIADLGKKAREKYTSVFSIQNSSRDNLNNDLSNNFNSTPFIVSDDRINLLEEHNYIQLEEIPYNMSMELETVEVFENKDGNVSKQEKNEPSTSAANLTEINGKSSKVTQKIVISGPTRTRQKRDTSVRKNALSYLTAKGENKRDLRQKEIELQYKKIEVEERRLALEEARLEMERIKNEMEFKEREQRLKIEKEKAEFEAAEKKLLPSFYIFSKH